MRENDFDAFTALLAAEAEIRAAKALSEGAMLLWWQRMRTYELEQVRGAFDRHGLDPERGRFMPQPSDLIAYLEGSRTDRAALAWGKAHEAMSDVGSYRDVCFDDPAINAVIQDLGGWPKVCRTPLAELGYLQHRFCQGYQAYVAQGAFDYPRRLMGERDADSAYLKKGLTPPAPALVGDAERARQVFMGGSSAGKTAITYLEIEQMAANRPLLETGKAA